MIVFEHFIMEGMNRLEAHAERLVRATHPETKRHEDVELILSAIEGDFSRLKKLLPPLKTDRIDAVARHIHFVRKGLREGNEGWVQGNASDIKKVDVPELRKKIQDYFQGFHFLPQELRAEVVPLLEAGEFDSAVRKAFLVLKEKAVKRHRMPKAHDGQDMASFLFSSTGVIKVHADEKRRKAFHDFASGFFRFFRNEFMHELGAGERASSQCALVVIAFMLERME